jgi:hypothetical protein
MRAVLNACIAATLGAALVAPAAAAVPPRGTAYHVYKPRPRVAPPASGPTMLYFGGPVIGTVKVAAVMWGNGVAKTTVNGIGGYFKAIVNSTYVDELAQYSTHIVGVNGKQGTNQTITRGSYLGTFTITPANTSKKLTDAQVQTELEAQIAAGKLPPQDLNTLYMIYFPASVVITLDGGRSCVSFGAYHEATSASVSAGNIFYGVMPNCGGGFSSITNVSSHEFGEAVTDAIPTPGSTPAYPQAWNNATGYEIGDLCEGYSGTLTAAGGKSYVVQQLFDNATNACATGNYTSP